MERFSPWLDFRAKGPFILPGGTSFPSHSTNLRYEKHSQDLPHNATSRHWKAVVEEREKNEPRIFTKCPSDANCNFAFSPFSAGKPLSEEHIRWERIGYDMTIKTSTTYANGTSYLHIKDARREDVGNFRCIADNRVANPTSRDVLLIVKCKYTQPETRVPTTKFPY